jgi:predicted MFS family arabinose efflux permease
MIGMSQVVRIILSDDGPGFPGNYAMLFGIAGTMFVITIPLPMFIRELPGGKPQEESPSLREYWPQLLHVLREDQPFRAMILTRILAGLFLLASPFYIGFATQELHMKSSTAVGNLLMMQTLGNVLGSLLFSWAGDRYLIQFVRLALLAATIHPIMALLAGFVGPAPLYVGFFAAGIMGGTLGLGFINWVISYASHDQRPIYSGLFNSMSAVALLTAPLFGGLIVQFLGYRAAFIAALVMILAALFTAVRYLEQPRHVKA